MADCKHARSHIVDSRPNPWGTRRRRECIYCGHRWTTIELEVTDEELNPGRMDKRGFREVVIQKFLEKTLAEYRDA